MNNENLENLNAIDMEISKDWDKETVIERVWNDLNGVVPHSTIERVVSEAALKYEEAPIKTYIPIFVHREAVNRLRAELPAHVMEMEGNPA